MHIGRLKKYASTGVKAIDITKFFGIDEGSRICGGLADTDNVTVLSGGAVKSMLSARNIDVGVSPLVDGIYTYSSTYDPEYETPTTPEWVYANICPASVLNYAATVLPNSRMFVATGDAPAKTKDGYRNIIAAFSEGENVYVFYDSAVNIIDQRRAEDYAKVGKGIVVQYYSGDNESEGTSCLIYTVTQLWLDVISEGKVTTTLVEASLKKRKKLGTAYDKSTLISEDNKNFKYGSLSYFPSLGASYTLFSDRVYQEIYPTLLSDYDSKSAYPAGARQVVCYRNKKDASDSEKLIMLPDMRLINKQSGGWSLAEKSTLIPEMDGAVQHFERLFGFKGEKLYASSVGDCTSYTEGVDNLPATAAWQTVTSERGGFTAIASFDGEVVAFTKSSMMTVRGTLLPFSVSYVGAYGCENQSALTVLGGYLYFASMGGIFRYNGSSVKCISRALSSDIAFEKAHLSTADGKICALFNGYDGLFVYEPQSECWTRQRGNSVTAISPSGDGGSLFYYKNGYKLYDVFGKSGGFSFSVLLGSGERKRIRRITVTALLDEGARLALIGNAGETVMKVAGSGTTITRSVTVRNGYFDNEAIHFVGEGNVTLYSVRVEYSASNSRQRYIK